MDVIFVLGVSILLQFAAAFYALWLMRAVGGRLAWLALSGALFMMGVRRSLTFIAALEGYPARLPPLSTELVALLISALMVVAVVAIRPIFLGIRRSEQALAREIRRNQQILDSSPDGFVITDVDGCVREVNRAACRMLGHTAHTLIGHRLDEFEPSGSGVSITRHIHNLTDIGQAWFETRLRHSSGDIVELDVTAKYVAVGEERFVYIFFRDITARNQAEAELFRAREQALVTLEAIGDGVLTTDIDGNIQYMNPVAETLTGVRATEVMGLPLSAALRLRDEHDERDIEAPVQRCIQENRRFRMGVNALLTGAQQAASFSVELSVSPIHNADGGVVGTVIVLHDVTELRGLASQLIYQATHDSLTGLINRREFEVRLEQALESAASSSLPCALCYLDLDQFKVVNDTSGHVAGDELLRQLSHELEQNIRDADTLARLGGDEFGILLVDCDLARAEQVADKLRAVVQDFRFVWQQNIFEIGVSIGLVPIGSGASSLTDLLSAADSACYVAKENGRNRVHVFQHDDTELARHHGQMQWMQRIQRALDDDRFQIHAQSIMPLGDAAGNSPHVELLIRMLDENGEIIAPCNFISAAERYHLMPAVDRWVVRNTFSILARHDLAVSPVGMYAINLSGQSLGDELFLGDVLQMFDEFGVDPVRICFEITETAVIANIGHAQHFIEVLRERGCRFSLDDFGSGLSSFSYLKVLPVDFLKIDGSFVQAMLRDENDLTMVKSINQIGHVMGMQTVAEFVEDGSTLEHLRILGVDYAQGYVIDRPRPFIDTLPPRLRTLTGAV